MTRACLVTVPLAFLLLAGCRAAISADDDQEMLHRSGTLTLHAPMLSERVGGTLVTALRILATQENPVLSEGARVSGQVRPQPGDALAVLVATEEKSEDYRGPSLLPEICGRLRLPPGAAVTLCDAQGLCAPLAPSDTPTIVCNLAFFEDLSVLFQLSTNPQFLFDVVRDGDWGLMQLVRRIREEPEALLEEAAPPDMGSSVQWRMTYAWLFVIGHELAHVVEPAELPAHPTPLPAALKPTLRDKQSRVACRNYNEYLRVGYAPLAFGMSDADTDAMAGGEMAGTVAMTRAVWRSELDADARAVSEIKTFIESLVEDSGAPAGLLYGQSYDAISLMALLAWYQRLWTFVRAFCPLGGKKDFILTRCTCASPENRRRMSVLLDEQHPPITLRAPLATDLLLGDFDFSEEPENVRNYVATWARVHIAVHNIAYAVAMHGCLFGRMSPSQAARSRVLLYDAAIALEQGDLETLASQAGSAVLEEKECKHVQ